MFHLQKYKQTYLFVILNINKIELFPKIVTFLQCEQIFIISRLPKYLKGHLSVGTSSPGEERGRITAPVITEQNGLLFISPSAAPSQERTTDSPQSRRGISAVFIGMWDWPGAIEPFTKKFDSLTRDQILDNICFRNIPVTAPAAT